MPLVSFVVIEYFCVQDVSECIENIKQTCAGIDVEILVSSNSVYLKKKQQELIEMFPGVVWVFNSFNGGFSRGMNSGLKKCKGDIVVVMNPDVRIHSESLFSAIEFLKNDRTVGLVGPKIIDMDGLLQDTCRPFMSINKFFCRMLKRIRTRKDVLLEKIDYEKVQMVDWVIGAFMMTRRDAIDQVGGLDEGYFLYVEDMDWCMRFWQKGYKIIYYPDLVVKYKGDRKSIASIIERRMLNRYLFYHLKSYFRFLMKFGINPKRPHEL